ncbi:IclR family transcriptional regulator C-terminal domain-containing protein [Paralcaligenes ginsengisoli]
MLERVSIHPSDSGVLPSTGSRALKGKESTLFVNSVDKALRVLLAFDGTQAQLSLSQIADHTDLDLSSAQRATYTLTTLGYLSKDAATKKFELAPRLLDFSYRYLASNELARRAIPYIQHLAQEAEEATNLTVLDDVDIVYVMRIASSHMLAPNVIVGTRIPAFCAAPGLAILAYMPSEEAEAILARTNLIAYTPYTSNSPEEILARLKKIRAAGFVRAEGEYYLGDVSTAAAILDSNRNPIGAVNVSVSKSRWNAHRDEKRIADLVMSTAAAISGQPR